MSAERVRVLIVDDSVSTRKSVRLLLDSIGIHDVVGVADGLKALELVKAGRFDIVLLDADMPVMNGLEFLAATRSETYRLFKVIMITGHNDLKTVSAAVELGAEDFIVKPISLRVLDEKIQRLLGKGPKEDQHVGEIEAAIRTEIQEEKWESALAKCRKMMEVYPSDKRFFLLAGEAFEGSGQLEHARKCFERAVQLTRSMMPIPLERLARVVAALGSTDSAVKLMEQAIAASHPMLAGPRKRFLDELQNGKPPEGES